MKLLNTNRKQRHRFTYHTRTVPGIKTAMQRIDDTINLKFLPALLDNRSLSVDERQLVFLPTRMGGLGIPIFVDICDEQKPSAVLSQVESSIRMVQHQENREFQLTIFTVKSLNNGRFGTPCC